MYEWFTSTGELKDAYKKYVDEGSSHFQGRNQHCHILSNHQELKKAIIEMLHAHSFYSKDGFISTCSRQLNFIQGIS
jgi:hypothetical protein